MKKLYELTFTAYAVAEDKPGALDALVDDCVVSSDVGMTVETREVTAVDVDWWDSLPYGGDGETTCAALVEQIINQGHIE